MSDMVMATCNPWKKSTTPVPEPPFIVLAATLNIAATTIGQHQAPMMAGRARRIAPTALKTWHTDIGAISSPDSTSCDSTAGGGPQEFNGARAVAAISLK